MAKRVVQRYLLGAVAFAIALVWTGVGFTSGFECLFAFTLVYLGASVMQQRRAVAERRNGRARRDREPSRARRGRTRSTPVLSDESGEWPQLAEHW